MCQIFHKIVYCLSHIYTCDTYLHPLSEPNDESKTPEIPSSLVALLEPQRRFLSTIPEISENNSSDQGDDSVFGRQGLTYICIHACVLHLQSNDGGLIFSSPDETNHQNRSKSLQGLGFLSNNPVMSENENSSNQDDSVFERRGLIC